MKKLAVPLAGAAVLALAAAPADAAPASKFSAHVADVVLVPETSQGFGPVTVLSNWIKTPNKKDLLIGVSLETGLYTDTTVRSKGGEKDTSTAAAGLYVSVYVDGQQVSPDVEPDEVIYDYRLQQLSATLQGIIEQCQDANGDGVIDFATECTVTEEEIQLVLDTMAAHHFNFVVRDLPAGDHLVEVAVYGTTDTSAQLGEATAKVTVGNGSLTVEEVRAINQDGGIVFDN